MNEPLCASVSSPRSADSPSLFLALVVCGDGHCWWRGHGCAHGCLRGQAAAKGDKIRVRRQFCSTWVEGRDPITVPNQSLYLFLVPWPAFYIHEGVLEQRLGDLRSGLVNCNILTVDSLNSASTGRRLSPWWRAESWWSDTALAEPTAAGRQKRPVSLPLCSSKLLRTMAFQLFVPGCPCSSQGCACLHAPTRLCPRDRWLKKKKTTTTTCLHFKPVSLDWLKKVGMWDDVSFLAGAKLNLSCEGRRHHPAVMH